VFADQIDSVIKCVCIVNEMTHIYIE